MSQVWPSCWLWGIIIIFGCVLSQLKPSELSIHSCGKGLGLWLRLSTAKNVQLLGLNPIQSVHCPQAQPATISNDKSSRTEMLHVTCLAQNVVCVHKQVLCGSNWIGWITFLTNLRPNMPRRRHFYHLMTRPMLSCASSVSQQATPLSGKVQHLWFQRFK